MISLENPLEDILNKVGFIGRENIVENILQVQSQTGCHLVFIVGDGGIGKTHLLTNLLASLDRTNQPQVVLQPVIDLYDVNMHSPEGLAHAIVEMFPKDTSAFSDYYEIRQKLDIAITAGEIEAASVLSVNLLNKCSEGLKEISAERGIVFALDTAERWLYHLSDKDIQVADAWKWLLSWLGNLPKALVLIAGRKQIKLLAKDASSFNPTVVPLMDFQLEETRKYVGEVKKLYLQGRGYSLEIGEDEINRVHELCGGRPILLSLYLYFSLQDLGKAKVLLDKKNDRDFREELINCLLSLPDLTNILPVMGRAPKGMDISLLQRFLPTDFGDETRQLKFDELKKYTFIKTFKGSDRVFLHEEMFSLLREIVYSKPQDVVDKDASDLIIKNYYDAAIRGVNKELEEIYEINLQDNISGIQSNLDVIKAYRDVGLELISKELEERYETSLRIDAPYATIKRIRELEQTRQVLYSEIVYYRLRQDISHGLQRYYRYAHQATINGDFELLQLLGTELLGFAGETTDQSYLPFIQGLLASFYVLKSVATRKSNRSEIALKVKSDIDQIENISDPEKKILNALLQPWISVSDVFAGNYEKAKHTLDEALDLFDQTNLPPKDWREWFKNVGIGFAHRQYGYLYRVQGEIEKASSEYLEALKFIREVNFWSEEATLRNDLGLAQAEVGYFMDARGNIRDGILRRFELGDGRRIVLSLSSWSQYALREGSYFDALQYGNKALRISKIMLDQRAQGLALIALSEANRRIAASGEGLTIQEQIKLLLRAKSQADDALYIFTNISRENSRIIDALIELGCATRDLLRVRKQEQSSDDYVLEGLKLEADQALLDAAKKAGDKIFYRKVDALVNRAWLGYYAQDEDLLKSAIREAERIFDPAYFFQKDGKPGIKEADANKILWSQLGKLHICQGHITLEKWLINGEVDFVHQAVKNYELALKYSSLFSADYRGLRQGRDSIFFKLNKLNKDQLIEFAQAAKKHEEQQESTSRSLLQILMNNRGLWYL